MKSQTMCLMPEKCNKCGQIYDLSYDLGGLVEEKLMMMLKTASKAKGPFCWVCRKK